MAGEFVIDMLGAQGDGVIQGSDGPVYVPYVLPGERVTAEIDGNRGSLKAIVEASADRIAPVCAHFARCGGCALQHMAGPAYLAWKREQVVQAFAARGIAADVAPVVGLAEPAGRRRAVLAARRLRSGVALGYHERRSRTIVDIADCPVLVPAIRDALPGIRALLGGLLTRRGEATITVIAGETGLDVAITGARQLGGAQDFMALANLAERLDLVRLTVDGETMVERRLPVLNIAGHAVTPPPGGFVQAVAEAEAALIGAVREVTEGARHIADLFAGIGTFALPLAERAAVTAVELDGVAASALEQAVRMASGLKPVAVVRRDLFREPLMEAELAGYEAVVFDPPRAGARAQAERLAASDVPRIAAVSCNPATLARDARILLDGGYRLGRVRPVDQFLFSAHIEVVADFSR
ncbi:MAG: hypothetical protein MI824_10370 [Hyphomicrobiales bacterium]|nr:hypothetical protein [Hyphomicrobiales bacterium]